MWAIAYAGLAVTPSFAVAVLHRHAPLVVAGPAGVLLLVSAGTQLVARRAGTTAASRGGLATVTIGLAALAAVPVWPSLPLLAGVLAVLGAGHGLCFMAALREATGAAAPGHDAATSAVFFAATYQSTRK